VHMHRHDVYESVGERAAAMPRGDPAESYRGGGITTGRQYCSWRLSWTHPHSPPVRQPRRILVVTCAARGGHVAVSARRRARRHRVGCSARAGRCASRKVGEASSRRKGGVC